MSITLALMLAVVWSWSLATANPLGGFVHVLPVAALALVFASLGRFRDRRVTAQTQS